ncbi:hypothetical protein [Candidatus Chromulinivorax destructor]|nr:hypothetical protein [Candidatus Chromulinivorax destructor]
MQNYKKIIIILILISSRIQCESWFGGVGKETAKILAPVAVDAAKGVGVEAVQALAPAVADAAKSLGSDGAIAIANSNLAIAKEVMPYVGPAMVAATVVAGVGVAAYSVTQLQPVIKDTCEIFYPTDKQIEENTAARERTAFYEARANLRKCFMDSKTKDKRNNAGYPTICEETVKMLIMCGGESEAERMIAGFNKYWN